MVNGLIPCLDKSLAKKTKTIAFFKVDNDGFGLGAQRREIDKNDLPQALAELGEYLRRLRAGESVEDLQPTLGLVVPKEKISANGDYNLNGERYRENGIALTTFPFRTIKDIAVEVRAGFASGQSSVETMGVPHVRPMNINEDGKFVAEGMKCISEEEFNGRDDYALDAGDVLFNNTNSVELVGKTCLIESSIRGGFSNHMTRIRVNRDLCVPRFLALLLHSAWRKGQFTERATRWVGQAGINTKSLSEFQIPLPPLEIQKEIVTEIEGYQTVIDGARAVLDNYHPHISINPDWPIVELGEALTLQRGYDLPKQEWEQGPYPIVGSNGIIGFHSNFKEVGPGVVTGRSGTLGKVHYIDYDYYWPHNTALFVKDFKGNDPKYLKVLLESIDLKTLGDRTAAVPSLDRKNAHHVKVHLPPVSEQHAIVAEIKAEQALVASNRELIARLEKKIQATLARVWGEDAPAPAEA